jgi:hypothetical protein
LSSLEDFLTEMKAVDDVIKSLPELQLD